METDVSDPKGKLLGKYFFYFNSIFSQSAFSSVYLGSEMENKSKIYAIRVMSRLLISPDLSRKIPFFKELKHPNIVNCHDTLFSVNNQYFIMDFCSSGNLASHLQKIGGHEKESEAKRILSSLVLGYREFFIKGLVHGGLKPDNILINEGVFKYEDFGMAEKFNEFKNFEKTLLYMSPERLLQQQYDSKTDAWSIGVIFYEILYGITPWYAKTPLELVKEINLGKLIFPLEPNISEGTKTFIKACLEIDKNKRISWDQIFSHELFLSCIDYAPKSNNKRENIEIYKEMLKKKIKEKKMDFYSFFIQVANPETKEIEKKSFMEVMFDLNERITFEEIEFLFNEIDKDGNKAIDFFEFCYWLSSESQNSKKIETNYHRFQTLPFNSPQPKRNSKEYSDTEQKGKRPTLSVDHRDAKKPNDFGPFLENIKNSIKRGDNNSLVWESKNEKFDYVMKIPEKDFQIKGKYLIPSDIRTNYGEKTENNQLILEKSKEKLEKNLKRIRLKENLFKKYEFLKFLGKGSFGTVFEVYSKLYKTKNALKIIQSEEEDSNQGLEEINNNYKLVGLANILYFLECNIAHTNYKIENETKILYQIEILMDLADGSLQQLIDTSPQKRVPSEKLFKIMKQVANGLFEAFNVNCAHLDIKPSNILIFGKIFKIADWGGSKFLKRRGSINVKSFQNQGNMMFITEEFVAPEFFSLYNAEEEKQIEKINFYKCDVYAFGLTLLNCCGINILKIKAIPKSIMNPKMHDDYMDNLLQEAKYNGYPNYILDRIREMCKYEPSQRKTITEIVGLIKKD